jgi:putative N6-adenine-specific DNA methylase
MCGSGTILIEAAFIAQHRAPGLGRAFAFEDWPSFDKAGWGERRTRAAAEVRRAPQQIIGSDLNAGSVGVARRNARRAGVLEALSLDRKDATEISPPAGCGPGFIASNLPYGRRVGGGDLIALHGAFGDAVRRFSGWRLVLLTGSERLADALGIPGGQYLDVDNGGLRCVLVIADVP